MTDDQARRIISRAFRDLERPCAPAAPRMDADLYGYCPPKNPFADYRIRIARLISPEEEDYMSSMHCPGFSRWRFRYGRMRFALGMLRNLHADASTLLNEMAANGAEPLETIFRYRMIERRYALDILYCIIFRSLYIEDAARRAVDCIGEIEALLRPSNLIQMPAH